jgi:hypothetical protein
LLLLAGCGAAVDPLPPDAVILPGSMAATMLHQCSRSAPAPGEGTWQPAAADVLALEHALPAAVRQRPELRGENLDGEPNWRTFPRAWRRQYVGIVRGGRRFVYGNFFWHQPDTIAEDQWRSEPQQVCDGGPPFFGVEYDVAARRFTHFAFNGGF